MAGTGYRFVATDGGIFSYGSSAFYGSAVAPVAPTSTLIATGEGWTSAGLQGPMPAPGTCHYGTAANGDQLQDRAGTPGAIDTAVTQANIQSTICVTGYTTTVRPPTSLTDPAKLQSMAAYSSPGSPSDYEYDHLVPLELGGSSDVRNLFPETHASSYTKDGVGNRLNNVVCSGASDTGSRTTGNRDGLDHCGSGVGRRPLISQVAQSPTAGRRAWITPLRRYSRVVSQGGCPAV